MNPLKTFFETTGYAMLDGGLSTELEQLGANLDDELWTSRVLIDAPELIQEAHRRFLHGGADIIATATYQATVEGLVRAGLEPGQAEELMVAAVKLAVDVRDEFWSQPANRAGRLRPLVAVSLGPYGACLHDGSEYHGNYGLGKNELMDFHRPRIALLKDTGADLFAFETFPSLLEAESVVDLLEEFPDVQAWLSFSCRDELRVAHGETFAECAELASRSKQILSVGVNCTAPENIPLLLSSAQHTGIPLAAYPNSGEYWDATAQQWRGQACGSMDVGEWHRLGTRLIGGCCRTTSDDIRGMRARLGNAV